jgi:hypothetical protein
MWRPDFDYLFYRGAEDHDGIIRHLEQTFEAERPPPPRVVQQDLKIAAEESVEY